MLRDLLGPSHGFTIHDSPKDEHSFPIEVAAINHYLYLVVLCPFQSLGISTRLLTLSDNGLLHFFSYFPTNTSPLYCSISQTELLFLFFVTNFLLGAGTKGPANLKAWASLHSLSLNMSFSRTTSPRGSQGRGKDPSGHCPLRHRRSNCALRPYAMATTSLVLSPSSPSSSPPASPILANSPPSYSRSSTSSSTASDISFAPPSVPEPSFHSIYAHIKRPRIPKRFGHRGS